MSIEELQAKNDNQDEIIADEHDEEEKVESNIQIMDENQKRKSTISQGAFDKYLMNSSNTQHRFSLRNETNRTGGFMKYLDQNSSES